MSRRRLAEMLGLNPSTIYRWENNKVRIPKWMGIALAAISWGVLDEDEFND